MKKTFLLTLGLSFTTAPSLASIPSSAFMREEVATQIATAVSTKVDTAASANQTLAGSYTVSGTFNVSTPTIPTAE